VLVRRAVAEDHEVVGRVTVAAYQDFLGAESDYSDRLRDAAARDREAELWVAEDDGQVVGTVTVCPPGSPWRELSRPDEGEFRMLAVAPEARGRGIGEALARMCLDRFRGDGARGVVICSLPEMTTAHRVYDRLGFRRAPELDWEPVAGVQLHGYRIEFEE
jgi:ribosomal protein S18 acetylase RimI-like enzyme